MKRGLVVVSVLILGAAAWILSARSGLLTPSEDSLRAQYQLKHSKFLTVEGKVVHYMDRGQGPAPAGRTDVEQELRIIAELTNRLGVEHFVLVGTSSAGVATASHAANHPQQVSGLILANIAVGAFKPPAVRRQADFWRQVLRAYFFDPAKVRHSLAREWAGLNNRAQRMPPAKFASTPMAEFDRTTGDLARITVPTSLLWSDHDHELPLETVGRKGLALLASADKQLQVVSQCGHMMPLEYGTDSARLARVFIERVFAVAT